MNQTQTDTNRGIVTKAALVCLLVVALHLFVSSAAAGGAPDPATDAPGTYNVSLTDGDGDGDANATWAIDKDAGTVNVTGFGQTNQQVANLPSLPENTTKAINFA
ncbi:MAG: hypothetical protein ACLFSW_06115, partial [Halobacteriales archaeon]